MSDWAIRQAARELRGAGRHFGYLVACVTLGVAALVAVGSLGRSLEQTVAESGKTLMGADLEIRASQALGAGSAAAVAGLARAGARATHVLELAAMAQTMAETRPAEQPRVQLVEIKAVEAGYPFYGRLVTAPTGPLDTLIGERRALVQSALLTRLGLAVGDSLRIGEVAFRIAGLVENEPDRAVGVFSLGPRVLIAAADLEATGLVRPGSRVRHRTLIRLPDGADAEAIRAALVSQLDDPGLRVSTYRQAQPGLRRFWDQLTMYLGLTGLVALLVGGIGVGVSVQAFLRRRRATLAILKSLGTPWRRLLAAYLLQTGALGLAGSLLGATIGSAVPPLIAPCLAPLLPFPLAIGVSPTAILRGIAMGLGVTLLCALPPLLGIRDIPPALVLRREIETRRSIGRHLLASLPVAAGLSALALWQAGSWKVGALFIGGFGGGLMLLFLIARLALAAARRLPRARWLAWRQGVAGLQRPGGQAGAVLVTLGLAVMLIVSVAVLERNLRRELAGPAAERAPAFFFIDIQPDQAEGFARVIEREAGTPPTLIPTVRARLAAVDGAPIRGDARRREEAWYLSREYVLTWAATPPGRNTVVAGRWWTEADALREPQISLEEELAKNLGVGLGETLTFDVQGVPISARVTSLRRVEWRTFGANFFVIFSPGVLDGAPTTYLATAEVPPAAEERLQSAVVGAFPNITAVPVREVLLRASGIVDQIAQAVRLVAGVSVLAGIVVLAGALSITRHERLYQSVIMKALGATRGVVARGFAVEYALLGVAAGLAGTGLAAGLAWAVQRWLIEIPWHWQPTILLGGVAGATLLALAVGFLGSFRLLGQKPLSVLRGE